MCEAIITLHPTIKFIVVVNLLRMNYLDALKNMENGTLVIDIKPTDRNNRSHTLSLYQVLFRMDSGTKLITMLMR